jgi:putative membrane protein
MIADRFVSGMRVSGFLGAIVAAIAIGVISWLLSLLLGALGIGLPGGNPLP